jgi:hypothetical protein
MKRYVHENSPYDGIFRGLYLMRKFKVDSKPYPQINKLVLSVFKNRGAIVYQRYYKERK